LRAKYQQNFLEFLLQRRFLSSLSSINLSVSIDIIYRYRYLFYILCCRMILLSFVPQIAPALIGILSLVPLVSLLQLYQTQPFLQEVPGLFIKKQY
jgi:hypothetical protein